MIKGMTTIRHVASAKEFAAVNSLLDSLGFEGGKPWKGVKSQGQYFLAPVGKLEIHTGNESFPADIWVEVTDLDSVYELLHRKKVRIVGGIEPTRWGSRRSRPRGPMWFPWGGRRATVRPLHRAPAPAPWAPGPPT